MRLDLGALLGVSLVLVNLALIGLIGLLVSLGRRR